MKCIIWATLRTGRCLDAEVLVSRAFDTSLRIEIEVSFAWYPPQSTKALTFVILPKTCWETLQNCRSNCDIIGSQITTNNIMKSNRKSISVGQPSTTIEPLQSKPTLHNIERAGSHQRCSTSRHADQPPADMRNVSDWIQGLRLNL